MALLLPPAVGLSSSAPARACSHQAPRGALASDAGGANRCGHERARDHHEYEADRLQHDPHHRAGHRVAEDREAAGDPAMFAAVPVTAITGTASPSWSARAEA